MVVVCQIPLQPPFTSTLQIVSVERSSSIQTYLDDVMKVTTLQQTIEQQEAKIKNWQVLFMWCSSAVAEFWLCVRTFVAMQIPSRDKVRVDWSRRPGQPPSSHGTSGTDSGCIQCYCHVLKCNLMFTSSVALPPLTVNGELQYCLMLLAVLLPLTMDKRRETRGQKKMEGY